MILFWIAFNLIIAAILVIDLKYLHKEAHEVSIREMTRWLAFLVCLALGFFGGIYAYKGHDRALQFLTGYVIEMSLSVDNLFVFLIIFDYFVVPKKYQARVLHWGILGAIVMRFILIFAGSALIRQFEWILYVFGAVLVFTGVRMATEGDEEKKLEPDKNPVVRLFGKILPTAQRETHDENFFVKVGGKLHATPLFIVLLLIESSDLLFAVDSIPAVFAVTTDFFIVYTSNVFAILGLRALYFLLGAIMPLFRFLRGGISIVLCFVGVKMLVSHYVAVPTLLSLGIIAGVLGGAVALSVAFPKKKETP